LNMSEMWVLEVKSQKVIIIVLKIVITFCILK